MTQEPRPRRYGAGPGRSRGGVTKKTRGEQLNVLHKLEHSRDQFEWWRTERNDLIAEAYWSGVSMENICKAAGVESSTVYTVTHRKRKAESA